VSDIVKCIYMAHGGGGVNWLSLVGTFGLHKGQ
jgi:hypothetical protein